MSQRLLVTGAAGFVGGNVVREAGPEWEVHGLSAKASPAQAQGRIWHTLDVLDFEQLRRVVREVKPHAVIHSAAIADIDVCEKEPRVADRINIEMTREMAHLCRELNIRIVHLSTDTVFDGQRGRYVESDPSGPVNHYGVTKAKAEEIVLDTVTDSAVARLALVMGFPAFGTGHTFLPRMIENLKAGVEFGVPDDEIRTPVDVATLSAALLELAGNDVRGAIHLSGNDVMRRFDMAQRIADRLGFSRSLIVVKNACDTPGRAPRPRDVSLDNTRARTLLRTPMRGLDDALSLILDLRQKPIS